MSWTEERVALLTKRWAEGCSCSQIAKELGGLTRSAVIGKVHRLGLSGRGAAATPKGGRPAKAVKLQPKPAPQRAPSKPQLRLAGNGAVFAEPDDPREPYQGPPLAGAFQALPGTKPQPWADLGARMCKWPIDVDGFPSLACAVACGDEHYCEDHERMAYKAAPPQQRTAQLIKSLRRYA